jgi:hypothetical protein
MILERWHDGLSFLQQQGFSLYAVFSIDDLPFDVLRCIQAPAIDLTRYRRLFLLGHGGRSFWQALQSAGMQGSDPVDTFVISQVKYWLDTYIGQVDYMVIYPNADLLAPLIKLGTLAGWHHPSPLGLGINAQYGLWFAYRAALLIDAELPITHALPSHQSPTDRHTATQNNLAEKISTSDLCEFCDELTPLSSRSPCTDCIAHPCVSACPAEAVNFPHPFQVDRCMLWRHNPDSPCRDYCFARMACPIAHQHHYTTEQIRYHALHSLQTSIGYGLGT